MQMQNAMNDSQPTFVIFPFPHLQVENQFLVFVVSRDNIVQDTLCQLLKTPAQDLKKPLRVVFTGEEAVDAGGVRKEFFILLMRELLNPKYGMFYSYPETNVVWFSESSFEENTMYFLVGTICGLAIYNFTIIDLPFPLAMYKKLLAEAIGLNDLKELSPTLVK
jgi:E3 ubiquitin-protein ligase HERC4